MGGIEISVGPAVEELEVRWLECPAYLFGVDLFNQNFYWESHEAWEEVWIGVGKRSLPGRMVQGMIQVAASLLKRHMGSAAGATSNFRKAQVHFDAVCEARGVSNPRNTRYLGVPLEIWRKQIGDYLDGAVPEQPHLVLRP